MNSNYRKFNNHSIHNRNSQARSSLTNDNDNTTQFNFSNDNTRLNSVRNENLKS